MSDRHRRYLAALGIPLWLSRRVLPGAAPPAAAADAAAAGAVVGAAEAAAHRYAVEAAAPTPAFPPAPRPEGERERPGAEVVAGVPSCSLPAVEEGPGMRASFDAGSVPTGATEVFTPGAPPQGAEPKAAAASVPADIDDWLPPEDEPPPRPAGRPARPAGGRAPPAGAIDEAIGPPGDEPAGGWVDYAAWAELADAGDGPAADAPPPPSPPPPADDRRARIARMDWDELATTVAGCTACDLCRTRTRTVFGTGDRRARLMIVGEAPGRDEDLQGEPFVGEAGRLLNEMLRAIGLSRSSVYIANVLKCRPPNNRDPLPAEAVACRAHLERQIALVAPALILAVGRISAHELLAVQTPVGRLRGRLHRYGPGGIPLIVTWHPAYLLRAPAEKGKSLDDLERVLDVLEGRATPAGTPPA